MMDLDETSKARNAPEGRGVDEESSLFADSDTDSVRPSVPNDKPVSGNLKVRLQSYKSTGV